MNPILDDELDEFDPLDEYEQALDQTLGGQESSERTEMLIEELGAVDDMVGQDAEILAQELERTEDSPTTPAAEFAEVGAQLIRQQAPAEEFSEIVAQQIDEPPERPQEQLVRREDERVSALVEAQVRGQYGNLRTRRGSLREGTGVG